jgi:tRNA-dihydrouridine synthase B
MKSIKPIRLGHVFIETPLALGPMAGVTDLPFRCLCKEQGAGLLYTEMVSAKAITYHNKNTEQLIRTRPEEKPVAVQLFGNDPMIMAEAAAMIEEERFDFFDINMGCPVPKVVNNGEGSALTKDPQLAGEIVKNIVKKVKKPVTAKIRIGFDVEHITAVEMAKSLEAAGAAMIAVHGRTREQYYSGRADWKVIRQVKEAVRIPVLGNGDVTDGLSAKAMLEETGCDGIMIARAAKGNPWIFREILNYLKTGAEVGRPSMDEVCDMILRHAKMLTDYKGESIGIREMRGHFSWYTAGMRNSSYMRREINRAETLSELEEMVEKLRTQNAL